MTDNTEAMVIQIVVTIMTPIVGLLIAIIGALVRKYLHLNIDTKQIENSDKLHALIEKFASTAVYKVEDEYVESDIDDKVARGQAKLNDAVEYVHASLERAGIKVAVDTSDVEAHVRSVVQQYLNAYKAHMLEYSEIVSKKIDSMDSSDSPAA